MHRPINGNVWTRFIVLVPLVAAGMLAQQPANQTTSPIEATVARLLKRIDELEAGQQEMQARLNALTRTPVVTPVAAPVVETGNQISKQVQDELAIAPERTHVLGPIEFHGFTDFDYGRGWFEKLPPNGLVGGTNGFTTGDFDLFTNTRISDHWSLVGEMLVTSDFSNTFSVEMDRLLLNYKRNDYFSIGIGKFTTGLGYYPNESHRAQYFQTAIGRPIMYADEDNGGILPVHGVGITGTGKIPSGFLGLHWLAEVSNGRSGTNPDTPIQNFADEGNGKAVDFGLYARPESLRGFRAGVSVYHDTLHPAGEPAVHQYIYTGHVVYSGPRLEFLNEAAMVHDALNVTDRVYRSVTGYSQISMAFGKIRPYARYDYQNTRTGDPLMGNLGRSNGPSVGVNRHLSNYVILKVQYGRLAERGRPSGNDFNAQLALAF